MEQNDVTAKGPLKFYLLASSTVNKMKQISQGEK